MTASASKSSKPTLQKTLSRRVSSNESTLTKPSSESSYGDAEAQTARRRPCGCNAYCVWVSAIICVLLLLLLIAGGIYFAFLQSNLPDVYFQRLDIYNLAVNDTGTDTLLTADFEARLNATNGSGKIEISYRGMTASLSTAGINFGVVNLPDLRQKPSSTEALTVRSVMTAAPVEDAAADDLQNSIDRNAVRVDLTVSGHVDFYVGGKMLKGFPFKISCLKIDQSVVDGGFRWRPRCSTSMSPF